MLVRNPSLVSALVLVSSLVLGAAAAWADERPAAPPPPVDQIHIEDISYSGSGCAPGTVAIALDADATAFTVGFSDFTAVLGPGFALPASRKNCWLNLSIRVPQGFTYALRSVDQRGFADLAEGAQGWVKTMYYFAGMVPFGLTPWTRLAGPFPGEWNFRGWIDASALIWAPCDAVRPIRINAQLRVEKGTSAADATSSISLDQEGLEFSQTFGVVWAHCPSNP